VVATQFDKFASRRRFLIRPNCSLPWRETVRFYLCVLSVSLGIALAFAWMGAWLVLPFAGLEMLVLGIALYSVARRAAKWQEISIHGEHIYVIEHAPKGLHEQSFQRAWARVVHEGAAIRGHPSKLIIRSHGRSVEIGNCLNEQEKNYLAEQLSRAVRV